MTPGLEFGACHRKQLGGVLTPGVDLKNLNEGSKMAARVRKAVLPVAGLGTRFLPATKAMPKEMLTVVDRPLIQYAVEECLAAAIEDHFDAAYELEATLQERGKKSELKQTQDAAIKPGNAIFTRQQRPLGLG